MDFPFLTYSAKSNDFVSCVMLFVREPAVNVYMHRLRFFLVLIFTISSTLFRVNFLSGLKKNEVGRFPNTFPFF